MRIRIFDQKLTFVAPAAAGRELRTLESLLRGPDGSGGTARGAGGGPTTREGARQGGPLLQLVIVQVKLLRNFSENIKCMNHMYVTSIHTVYFRRISFSSTVI